MSGILQAMLAAGVRVTTGSGSGSSVLAAGTATAQIQYTNTGDINATLTNNSLNDIGDWVSPKFNFANYDIRVTLSAGAFSTGTNNTWQNLGTTRTWTLSQVGTGSTSCTYTVEIRDTFSGNVLASVVGSLNATVS